MFKFVIKIDIVIGMLSLVYKSIFIYLLFFSVIISFITLFTKPLKQFSLIILL